MSYEPSYYEAKKSWEAEQRSRRRGRPRCERCGREILFIQSAKSTEDHPPKLIPVDPRLDYGDGQRTLVTLRGRMIPQASPKVLGREPHFGTCPTRQR